MRPPSGLGRSWNGKGAMVRESPAPFGAHPAPPLTVASPSVALPSPPEPTWPSKVGSGEGLLPAGAVAQQATYKGKTPPPASPHRWAGLLDDSPLKEHEEAHSQPDEVETETARLDLGTQEGEDEACIPFPQPLHTPAEEGKTEPMMKIAVDIQEDVHTSSQRDGSASEGLSSPPEATSDTVCACSPEDEVQALRRALQRERADKEAMKLLLLHEQDRERAREEAREQERERERQEKQEMGQRLNQQFKEKHQIQKQALYLSGKKLRACTHLCVYVCVCARMCGDRRPAIAVCSDMQRSLIRTAPGSTQTPS